LKKVTKGLKGPELLPNNIFGQGKEDHTGGTGCPMCEFAERAVFGDTAQEIKKKQFRTYTDQIKVA